MDRRRRERVIQGLHILLGEAKAKARDASAGSDDRAEDEAWQDVTALARAIEIVKADLIVVSSHSASVVER